MCESRETPKTSLTRRQALGAAGTAGVAFLFAGAVGGGSGNALLPGTDLAEAASATCVMTPNKTIGPYFVDEKLNRSTVTSDADGSNVQPGTPLALTMYVFDANSDCAPVAGAVVDIWHANYEGKYSDEAANGTSGHQWLRGYQVTDADGKVVFHTTWPGWYSGRAVHIHFRVRTSSLDFTSQMFFTDAMNATVFASAPYSTRGTPNVLDSQDNILGGDGATLTLNPTASGGGYAADFSVGLSGGSTGNSSGNGTSGTADTVCEASLKSARAVRLSSGRRQVRVRVRSQEEVKLTARVTRNGHRLAKTTTTLDAGTHTVKVTVGSAVHAGAARLTLSVADAAGNSKKYHRSLHIPKRKA